MGNIRAFYLREKYEICLAGETSPFKIWLILLVRHKKDANIISRSKRFKHHLRTSGFQLPLPQIPRPVLLINFLCIYFFYS
ncbi:hypothetical protein L211DRAFT_448784 [Terfezia boudieri ATCC MYA-4762]|uniref:Uncharacterized protein n=1 Tax=Terfezia boudieri ATCC MYA-4762 TaxID=1051890 RepID=A0A3N4LF02_9PEZI|nr:hypothetical protein L211DRAFT_448784 [Terfezia boudieri ATCC MYA-4762]